MSNLRHVDVLMKGSESWNKWRVTNHVDLPDLSEADLSAADLRGADLRGADLRGADLSAANLWMASLRAASLSGANLNGANLSGADLLGANLSSANLSGTDLSRANLSFVTLRRATLTGADLSGADLSGADLRRADLSGAIFQSTRLCSIDLSETLGLQRVGHYGPSSVGIDTLYASQGEIPDEFLRGAGVPDEIIEHFLPLIRNSPAIQWHSCFISYSKADEEFARRLHSRMREANMRVWFPPEDLAGGKKLHEQLFSAIQIHDKLLLVLSTHSMQSEWVMTEIRKAREVERKENRRKLFPIRLVDYKALKDWSCFDTDSGKDLAVEVREYFIPDFSDWKDHDAFEQSFKRLQKDLASTGKDGSGTPGKSKS